MFNTLLNFKTPVLGDQRPPVQNAAARAPLTLPAQEIGSATVHPS